MIDFLVRTKQVDKFWQNFARVNFLLAFSENNHLLACLLSTHPLVWWWNKFKLVVRACRRDQKNTLFSSLRDRKSYCKMSTILQLRCDLCFLNLPSVMLCDMFQREVVLPQLCSFAVKHLQTTNEHEREQSTCRSFSPWNRFSLVSYYWKLTVFLCLLGTGPKSLKPNNKTKWHHLGCVGVFCYMLCYFINFIQKLNHFTRGKRGH